MRSVLIAALCAGLMLACGNAGADMTATAEAKATHERLEATQIAKYATATPTPTVTPRPTPRPRPTSTPNPPLTPAPTSTPNPPKNENPKKENPQLCKKLNSDNISGSPRQIMEGEGYLPGYNEVRNLMAREELFDQIYSSVGNKNPWVLYRFSYFMQERVAKNVLPYYRDEAKTLNDIREDILDYIDEHLKFGRDVWATRERGLLLRHEGQFVAYGEPRWEDAKEHYRSKLNDLNDKHMKPFVDEAKKLCPSALKTLR